MLSAVGATGFESLRMARFSEARFSVLSLETWAHAGTPVALALHGAITSALLKESCATASLVSKASSSVLALVPGTRVLSTYHVVIVITTCR